MKSETQRAAEELMRAAGQTIRSTPGEPSEADRILRAKLIMEETLETIKALGVDVSLLIPFMDGTLESPIHDVRLKWQCVLGRFDLVASIDGCCDLNVVVAGTLSALGVPDIPVQREVERSNRSKLLPDGTLPPHPSVPGKFGKGPGYTPPDIAGVIKQAGDPPLCDRCEKSPCRCDITAVISNALSAAISAIYFADSSDYLSALWEIVGTLGGSDAVSLLSDDERAAYETYCSR